MAADAFDPHAKEAALRAESVSWDTSRPADAEPGDIPIIDIGRYLATRDVADLTSVAAQLNSACEDVGFYQLVGHGVDTGLIADVFEMNRRFHALPLAVKNSITMDRADWPIGGVGYLPMRNRKLPTRDRGNLNEAFITKGQVGVTTEDSQWLVDEQLPGFRPAVEQYAAEAKRLALELVPIYATALGLDTDHFNEAFDDPTWRLRLTHYPPVPSVDGDDDDFGIAPHVDTTFFTLLLQDSPGLTIFSHQRNEWIQAPVIDGAFVVNSGELLKHWTNDRYISVRHFATNSADEPRYSVPFFYNANADYPMAPLATCVSDANPARYATISYNQSQAIAQGE